MKFSGRLQIEADPRNWLKTELDLSQGRLELVSGGEILGSWATGQVKAERLEGDRFQLQLGADRAVFAADDALAFSYEALPALAKKSVLSAATGLREKLRKGITGTERAPQADPEVDHADGNHQPDPEPVEVYYEVQPLASSIAAPPTRRLRELIQEAVKNNAAEAAAQAQSIHWESRPAVAAEVEGVPGRVEDEIETEDIPEYPPVVHYAPAAIEPATPEPAWPETVWPETAQQEPAQPELVQPEPVRPEPARPEPPRPEMIDRVGALRPLFEADRAAIAEVLSPVALLPPVQRAHQPSVTIRPPEEVVKAAFPPLRPVPEVTPSPSLRLTLDALIEEVRKGEMSPMQIIAVTDLVRAVAEAIEDRNRA